MTYSFQLTKWYDNEEELDSVIRQIEKYEGVGRGYEIKHQLTKRHKMRYGKITFKDVLQHAVFTTGEFMNIKPEKGLSYSEAVKTK